MVRARRQSRPGIHQQQHQFGGITRLHVVSLWPCLFSTTICGGVAAYIVSNQSAHPFVRSNSRTQLMITHYACTDASTVPPALDPAILASIIRTRYPLPLDSTTAVYTNMVPVLPWPPLTQLPPIAVLCTTPASPPYLPLTVPHCCAHLLGHRHRHHHHHARASSWPRWPRTTPSNKASRCRA